MRIPLLAIASLALMGCLGPCSCTTAPQQENRATFSRSSDAALLWFESNVPGLRGQISRSAGYLIFPDVAQWGILFGGGQFGRGEVCRPSGVQIGWGALNTGSVGLQAGVRGFKMLMVIEDEPTLYKLMKNELTGSVNAVGVVGEYGSTATVPFNDGVAIYQGASSGLIAGANIALDYIRFKSLAAE